LSLICLKFGATRNPLNASHSRHSVSPLHQQTIVTIGFIGTLSRKRKKKRTISLYFPSLPPGYPPHLTSTFASIGSISFRQPRPRSRNHQGSLLRVIACRSVRASRGPREIPVGSGVATHGDLDSHEGPGRAWRTRGVAGRTNGRTRSAGRSDGWTDGRSSSGVVARRWASVRMINVGRRGSAPSNSVQDDARLRRRRRRRRRQVHVPPVQGEQALCWVRQPAPRRPASPLPAAAPSKSYPPHCQPLPFPLPVACNPRERRAEASWTASRRATPGRTAALESALRNNAHAEFNVRPLSRACLRRRVIKGNERVGQLKVKGKKKMEERRKSKIRCALISTSSKDAEGSKAHQS